MEERSEAHGATDAGQDTWMQQIWARVSRERSWKESQETEVLKAYHYLDEHPGKEIRSKLIEAFQVWLPLPEDALQMIADVVRRLHTASLLVDDIEDNSILRRGMPTAHTIFGTAQTLNAANYVYFEVLDVLGKAAPETHQMVISELLNLHRGQGMDLVWRENFKCPSEDEYIEMVLNKTGGLFRIAVRLMCLWSNVRCPDLIPLVNIIGILFQIRDDYLNLLDTPLQQHKGFCEDLTEGKFSFPIVHAMHHGKEPQLLPILRQRTTNVEKKRYALSMMRQSGSFEYTREVLRRLHTQAKAEVVRIGTVLGTGNALLLQILDDLQVND
ncbi:hypothetical protein MPSI1_002980 [Malassezia psittaci]|uniref:(2E,6E)-farnesyl diphosphate synthase n=1 Tax=Malassezia psittaci TaxID=1821823 RepID=A0AAF0F7W5_9BASI|nr:hypothetical protein MPSI1_002980 [Malassezia psittaci]